MVRPSSSVPATVPLRASLTTFLFFQLCTLSCVSATCSALMHASIRFDIFAASSPTRTLMVGPPLVFKVALLVEESIMCRISVCSLLFFSFCVLSLFSPCRSTSWHSYSDCPCRRLAIARCLFALSAPLVVFTSALYGTPTLVA